MFVSQWKADVIYPRSACHHAYALYVRIWDVSPKCGAVCACTPSSAISAEETIAGDNFAENAEVAKSALTGRDGDDITEGIGNAKSICRNSSLSPAAVLIGVARWLHNPWAMPPLITVKFLSYTPAYVIEKNQYGAGALQTNPSATNIDVLGETLLRDGDLIPADNKERLSSERLIDQTALAGLGHLTSGLSPIALTLAVMDWGLHLAVAPGKRLALAEEYGRLVADAMQRVAGGPPQSVSERKGSPRGDLRFSGDAWNQFPFQLWANTFCAVEDWWTSATRGVPGVSPHHEAVVSFAVRQWLDIWSPSNSPLANPAVAQQTLREGGLNLVRGAQIWLEDAERRAAQKPPVGVEAFKVGETVAATPGQVVFRNHLIELIQYSPAGETVHAEPVLIVPAWIMKYYILDLSPHNSLIKYLVDQGYTVFCISWRNVTEEDRNLSLEDYRRLGVMAALDTISAIVPDRQVHAAGYCLGGTLLSIAAAAMAETGDHRLKSMTLFAAQTDFTEPGELQLFIDHSQVAMLEALMWQSGTLDSSQMAGAFQLLKSNDLIWSHMIHDYLMGQRTPMIDLMAWNADATRMPFQMHSDYLRKLFLRNDLASGRYVVDGNPIAIQNIRAPIFSVGTERDHIAPWHSVYKIHYLTDTDVTFVLTNGGHNAGIVNEPGHSNRHFRLLTKAANDICLSADEWFSAAPVQEGSWWPIWTAWLATHSSSERIAPPSMGSEAKGFAPLGAAPGTYVLQQ